MPCLYIGRIRRRLLSAREERAISRRNSRVTFGSHRAPTFTSLGSLHSRGGLLFPLIVFASCSTFPGIASPHSVYHSSTTTSTAAHRASTERDSLDERQLRGVMGYDLRPRQKALAALLAHLGPVRVHGPAVRALDHLGLTPLHRERSWSPLCICWRGGTVTSARPLRSLPSPRCHRQQQSVATPDPTGMSGKVGWKRTWY